MSFFFTTMFLFIIYKSLLKLKKAVENETKEKAMKKAQEGSGSGSMN
jgi:hypothetical protein